MTAGIRVNGQHSYAQHGLRMLEHTIGSPPKDDHTERVPYSNITYDFDEILGLSSYGERTLSYVFDFICLSKRKAQDRIIRIRRWLQWTGRKDLCDPSCPDYHFEVRAPEVTVSENHGVYTISVTFKANPAMLPNSTAAYTADTCYYPDVNGDGNADAQDASLILEIASAIGSGKDTGMTDEQLLAADADMDGEITAADAALVQNYAACVGAGEFADTPSNWAAFLNRQLALEEGVY